ncbi:MAG: hypothetical protein A2710_24375 [Burkholderiales bacterium RIFCSPHIGHO2_01_FULL_64_960]|nr:MAG: hypothetical protein A2710_24375 [Burkholderiales bacterium RIFCSPHIGHO2_01_FULL_64_960]
MSAALFSLNADLKRLRDEGYRVHVEGGNLVMREIPYLDAAGNTKLATIMSSLCLAGNITQKPEPHTVTYEGEFPCDVNGNQMALLAAGAAPGPQGTGVVAQYQLSRKPGPEGYIDYYQKMSTYATMISGPAAVKNGATPRVLRDPDPEEDSIFNYVETASDRAGIGNLTALLMAERVAIIGVGGTGSYILDQVAKTPVREIRIIDADEFLQHNAFRAPGAASMEQLREVPKKVEYFAGIYSRMHRGIVPHPVELDASNIQLLEGVSFAFLCIDAGNAKRLAVEKLELMGVPFIDVGMGIELSNGTLGGILRVTASLPEGREQARGCISFDQPGGDNVYASNIQVADLNMLNAALAVIKWKKILGFYRDLDKEFHCSYTTDGNMLLNKDLQ